VATGTGKTVVAFQLCWRLWSTMWNLSGEYRKPRILNNLEGWLGEVANDVLDRFSVAPLDEGCKTERIGS
jgi:Type III restriction enzyme, res subunit